MHVHHKIRKYIVDNILFGDATRLDEDTSFQEGGILDSMGFLELITFVEEEFDICIADHELIPDNFDTLQKVSGFVAQKLHAKALSQSSVSARQRGQ